MTEREALKMALEALEYPLNQSHENFNVDMAELLSHRAITAIKEALAQPEQEPVQVSPLDFVTMTLEKEHLVGKPIIWAQWPNEEKNT